ncbi:MAG: sulfotransferase [Dermatophilaceae bacterium]
MTAGHGSPSVPSASGHDPVEPVRVLYIAGSGRSGTTVINNILGQVDGVFAAGELRYLWQRGMVEDRLCGCGASFGKCPTWGAVLTRALIGHPGVRPSEVAGRLLSRLRLARVPVMLGRRMRGRRAVAWQPDDVLIENLYRALAAETGQHIIVDSSKLPPYGLLLSALPGVELYILHIVRDPRATAFSWRRPKRQVDFGDDQLMPLQQPWKSSLLWLVWNALTVMLWQRAEGRYLRVRYEDFVCDPRATMSQVATMVGVDPSLLPFETPTSVRLSPTHSVAGNPDRHRSGSIELASDSEWLTAMPAGQRALVTALTAPALVGFGYPLVPKGSGRGSRLQRVNRKTS